LIQSSGKPCGTAVAGLGFRFKPYPRLENVCIQRAQKAAFQRGFFPSLLFDNIPMKTSVTVAVEPELWQRFQAACEVSETTTDDVIEQLVAAWTDAQEVTP
jgi:hypothetical protein